MRFADQTSVMQHAHDLAIQGQGLVEPNPLVGAVLVDESLTLLGAGWHRLFGEAHAEVEAIRDAEAQGNRDRLKTATLYVSLEPCCHVGKTPPCTQAILAAGIGKVVVGRTDPSPHANGAGIAELRAAGVQVEVGLLEAEAKRLTSPFAKRIATGMPWVIAKWAMSWDGKIATSSGDSKWISNEASRAVAHHLRGRMDAIIVGAETVRRDDPHLTARPAGPRTATRVVLDSIASVKPDSQLVQSIAEAPLLIIAGPDTPAENEARLKAAGVEVCILRSSEIETPVASAKDLKRIRPADPREALLELGRRGMTNVLIEGGGTLLGSFADQRLIDEVHVFIAAKLIGGQAAPSPLSGQGVGTITEALLLEEVQFEAHDSDLQLQGIIAGHRW